METIEQKAKAYDEAYERAKKLKETCDSNAVVGWMEYIFPELKEIEDEKIRKALINHFRCVAKNGDTVWTNLDYDKVIAWLEKHRHTDIALENEYWRGYDDAKMNMEEKQGEQKPAWSEEDEARFESCIKVLQTSDGYETINTKWFKSLKDRVQPKQEWSEENEKVIDDAESWLDMLCGYLKNNSSQYIPVVKEVISKLKSLRPQNTWKPSDEQIEVLREAVDAEIVEVEDNNNSIYAYTHLEICTDEDLSKICKAGDKAKVIIIKQK